MKNKVYFPGLDGLRGIAALTVVAAHMLQSRPWIGLRPVSFLGFEQLAQMAVTFFFVLSGFLITYLLILEKEQTGTISVRKFYFRRILRIWPLYFLIVLGSFCLFFFTPFFDTPKPNAYLALLLYCFGLANIVLDLGIGLPSTDPLWSIGVEEQFYFAWPLLLKKFSNIKRVLIATVLIYLTVKSLIILYYYFDLPNRSFFLTFINHFRIDSMAIGGLGAFFLRYGEAGARRFIARYFDLIVAGSIIILLTYNVTFSHLNYEVYSVLFLWLIYNIAFNDKAVLRLRGSVLTYLGKISYGIYMYHMLIVCVFRYLVVNNFLAAETPQTDILFNISVPLLTILVASLSYEYFEKSILRFKSRFAIIKSGISN